MGFYALIMMKIALELAKQKPMFERLAIVYFEHFIGIAASDARNEGKADRLWDEQDGFFYDTLCFPDGEHLRLKVRSFVGLIPFFSVEYFDDDELSQYPHFYKHFQFYISHFQSLLGRCITEFTNEWKKAVFIFVDDA